jgi:hypothetical protein
VVALQAEEVTPEDVRTASQLAASQQGQWEEGDVPPDPEHNLGQPDQPCGDGRAARGR